MFPFVQVKNNFIHNPSLSIVLVTGLLHVIDRQGAPEQLGLHDSYDIDQKRKVVFVPHKPFSVMQHVDISAQAILIYFYYLNH